MWSDKTVWLLRHDSDVHSAHDSEESAEQELAKMTLRDRKEYHICGPWMIHEADKPVVAEHPHAD